MENEVDYTINSRATYQVLIMGIGGICFGIKTRTEPLFRATTEKTTESSFINDIGTGVSPNTSGVNKWFTTGVLSPGCLAPCSFSLPGRYYRYRNDLAYDENNLFRSLIKSCVSTGTIRELMFKVQTCRIGFMTYMQNGMSALSWNVGGHLGLTANRYFQRGCLLFNASWVWGASVPRSIFHKPVEKITEKVIRPAEASMFQVTKMAS